MFKSGSLTMLIPFVIGCLVLAAVGEVKLAAVCVVTFVVAGPVAYMLALRRAKRQAPSGQPTAGSVIIEAGRVSGSRQRGSRSSGGFDMRLSKVGPGAAAAIISSAVAVAVLVMSLTSWPSWVTAGVGLGWGAVWSLIAVRWGGSRRSQGSQPGA